MSEINVGINAVKVVCIESSNNIFLVKEMLQTKKILESTITKK